MFMAMSATNIALIWNLMMNGNVPPVVPVSGPANASYVTFPVATCALAIDFVPTGI